MATAADPWESHATVIAWYLKYLPTCLCFLQICTPDLVVFLACANQRLRERLVKRAEQQGRPDDNLKATQRRLVNFKQNAAPLVKYFQEKGLIMTVSWLHWGITAQEWSYRPVSGPCVCSLRKFLDLKKWLWGQCVVSTKNT